MIGNEEEKREAIGCNGVTVSAVYCKLFSDTITSKVCCIRKTELNGRGGFSCSGCKMDA